MNNPLEGQTLLLLLVFGGFLVDWLAIACQWKRLKPITKPIAMLGLIFWTFSIVDWNIDLFAGVLIAAQFFGLMGDIFLLLPTRWFLWGLIAFFIGHICYFSLETLIIYDMVRIGQPERFFFWVVICSILWLILLTVFYTVFGLHYKNRQGKKFLWIAIQVYFWILSGIVVISLLVVLMRSLPFWRSLILPLGAALFLLSDTLLATNRFIKPINQAQLKVRITYHLAQVLLAIGLLQYGF